MESRCADAQHRQVPLSGDMGNTGAGVGKNPTGSSSDEFYYCTSRLFTGGITVRDSIITSVPPCWRKWRGSTLGQFMSTGVRITRIF